MITIDGKSVMSFREMIQNLLSTIHDLDQPAMIRIVRKEGNRSTGEWSVNGEKFVPIQRVHFPSDALVVDQWDIDDSKWQDPT